MPAALYWSARLTGLFAISCLLGLPPFSAASDHLTETADGSQPLTGLGSTELARFVSGKREFAARWVAPFISGGHWGRGPHSNAESCISCHPGNGRGRAPNDRTEAPHSLVLRLSVPNNDAPGGSNPHPVYGTHLNRHGVTGDLVEEGDFRIEWPTHEVTLADGERVELRQPEVHVTALWYGPLGQHTVLSLRLAQPVFGLGLLEAISEEALQAIAVRQRLQGVNGRINRVHDHASGTTRIGRFGHKASHPSVLQQSASAFLDEIGITTSMFPGDACSPIQTECDNLERLSTIEARDEQLSAIVDYLRMLAPPPQRDVDNALVAQGRKLFERAGCSVCHVPTLKTATDAELPALRNRTIHPYTDLLLHDMGEGLADGRRESSANGRDWRTPPLWGLGLRRHISGNADLLHDGRARTVTEAILWHGGEAAYASDAFIAMNRAERSNLLRFLDSL